jgi:tripartite-type tricarboxylate transporter receptor subunit TctC
VSVVRTRVATLLAILATIACFVPRAVLAVPTFSDWPSRDVKIIVPFPAGSADDVAARLYAEGLSGRWRRLVIVENRPGGDAMPGGDASVDARDDHTLLYGTASMFTAHPLLQGARSDPPMPDVLPIAPAASAVLVVAVADTVPARSLKELVELARSRPGELSWSAGRRVPHLVFAVTVRRHRLDMLHVPPSGALTTVADRSEGRAHVYCNSLQAIAGLMDKSRIRILAVTSPQREAMLPGVATVAEAGFPEMEIEDLSGLFGWRNMPPELRDRIAADMRAVAGHPLVHARFAAKGLRVVTGTPAEFAAAIGRQRIRIQQIIHAVGATDAR